MISDRSAPYRRNSVGDQSATNNEPPADWIEGSLPAILEAHRRRGVRHVELR